MSRPGDNLPGFRSVQLDFAAHIRNPDVYPRPGDVEARRMQVYVDLFFNNIRNFLDSAFPVAAKIVGEERWLKLVREFVHQHASTTPYFLEISQEFLGFLQQRGLHDLPPFLLELCHYEWVELALDVAEDESGAGGTGPAQESMRDDSGVGRSQPKISGLARALVYEYPVHEIGVDYQPGTAPELPTYLLVYRNPELQVRFMTSNAVTHRLLELLEEYTVEAALETIHTELAAAGREISFHSIQSQGEEILTRLHDVGIITYNR